MARIFTDAGGQSLATASQTLTMLDTFSVAFWIYRTATPVAAADLISSAGPQDGWYLQLTTANLVQAGISAGGGDKVRNSATIPALNTWHHVLVTHENRGLLSTDFLFYFNGKQEAGTNVSSEVAPHTNAAFPLVVGQNASVANRAPPARFGSIAIWNRALSPAEALALASGEHPLRFKEGLVEIFDMNTAAGEEGWLARLYLVQGATNPTSAAVSPPLLPPPGSQPGETHLNVRPTVRSRARYFRAGFVNTPVALAVSSAFTAALSRQGLFARALAVASTFTPSLVRVAKYARTLAVPSTFTSALNRGYARALAVTSSMTPALVKARSITLAVTSAFGPVVSRGVLYLRTLAVASTFTPTLSRVAARFRALAVSTVTTVSLTAGRAYARTLAVGSTMTPALARARGVTLAVASTFTPNLTRLSVYLRTLAVSSTFAAALRRGLNRTLAVSSTFTPGVVFGRAYQRTVAASSTFTAALTRRLNYARAIAVSSVFAPFLSARLALSQRLAVTGVFTASIGRRLALGIRLGVSSVFSALVDAAKTAFGSGAAGLTGEVHNRPRLVGNTRNYARLDAEPESYVRLTGTVRSRARFDGHARSMPRLEGEVRNYPVAA